MLSTIESGLVPSLSITLDPGEGFVAEAGCLVSAQPSVQLRASVPGGLMAGLGRLLAKSSFSMLRITGPGEAVIAKPNPGVMLDVSLDDEGPIYVQSGAFLGAWGEVAIEAVSFEVLGRLLRAGPGHLSPIMLKLSGTGRVFLAAGGASRRVQLGRGEALDVGAGHVVYLSSSIGVEKAVRAGVTDWVSAGLYGLCRLTGPGVVSIQSAAPASPARVVVGRHRRHRPHPPWHRDPVTPPDPDQVERRWIWPEHRGD